VGCVTGWPYYNLPGDYLFGFRVGFFLQLFSSPSHTRWTGSSLHSGVSPPFKIGYSTLRRPSVTNPDLVLLAAVVGTWLSPAEVTLSCENKRFSRPAPEVGSQRCSSVAKGRILPPFLRLLILNPGISPLRLKPAAACIGFSDVTRRDPFLHIVQVPPLGPAFGSKGSVRASPRFQCPLLTL